VKEKADAEAAIAAASRLYADEYLDEVSETQGRQTEVMQRALQQSMSDALSELQARLERQYEDLAKGKDMGVAIRRTNAEIEEVTAALEQRRAALERRGMLSIQTPRVVGVAAVLPGPVPRAVEEGMAGGDRTAVELAAMEAAMAFERAAGREPVDVSKTGVGYDIRSGGEDGEVRYIEVKGHGTTGDVTLYYTEWQTAHRMREEFYIYVVDRVLSGAPELWMVQDPVGKGIEPVEKVVEYRIGEGELRAVAEVV
jgi:hypothetical protein